MECEDGDHLAKPVGEAATVSGKGPKKMLHYLAFELDGEIYNLDDEVLLSPESEREKPYAAIIKGISQDVDGKIFLTGQWLYRPEEARKIDGSARKLRDTRELFYSFHTDMVPAESVMHKCVVHYILRDKRVPLRTEHPGFVVQMIYDHTQRILKDLVSNDYDDEKQCEIKLLVEKTRDHLGDLPDIVKDAPTNQDNSLKSSHSLRRNYMHSVAVGKAEGTNRSDHLMRTEVPGSSNSEVSEYLDILVQYNARTGDPYRDKWLEKLLRGIQAHVTAEQRTSRNVHGVGRILWPETAVSTMTALEKATFNALRHEFQKYNQKMRQLNFNLKNSALLAKRLLNKELDPRIVMNMTPNELKEGVTAEEKTTEEFDESKRMRMTDARCSRCMEKKVGIAEIIYAGRHGDRYRLECIPCGHTWYASRDAISQLEMDTPPTEPDAGASPFVAAKFHN